jgi:hypothetical protein
VNLKNLLSRLKSLKSGPPNPAPEGHSERAFEGIPDFVQPLIGWRAWKVWSPRTGCDSCPVFSSVILDTPWTPRRKISAEHSFDLGAKCHGLLEMGCSCGIYAFKDPLEAFVYLMKVRDRLLGMSVEVALGAVSLWGKVVECESGYKAQYAYPCHFYLPASFARFLTIVSSAFGVPAGIYASTLDAEIRLALSAGSTGRDHPELCLKNSGSVNPKGFPYEAGFYDLAPLPGGRSQFSTGGHDFSLPAT